MILRKRCMSLQHTYAGYFDSLARLALINISLGRSFTVPRSCSREKVMLSRKLQPKWVISIPTTFHVHFDDSFTYRPPALSHIIASSYYRNCFCRRDRLRVLQHPQELSRAKSI